MGQIDWTTVSMIGSVVTPVLGVPLTMITLYLKNLRSVQLERYEELLNRFMQLEDTNRELSQGIRQFEREYTTKAEWLRESIHARTQLQRLTEMVTRIEVELGNGRSLVQELSQAARALARLTESLAADPATGSNHPEPPTDPLEAPGDRT